MTLLLITSALAGAFGIEPGTPISALDHPVAAQTPDVYTVTSVPMPNSEFSAYAVVATPSLGVCKVVGLGRAHPGDLDGSQVRGVASAFSTLLEVKYGKSESFDFLHAGSIWKDPGDFAMGLYLNQRTLTYMWGAKANLPDDIEAILLKAVGTSATSTSITLGYEFSIFEAYADAKKRVDGAGL